MVKWWKVAAATVVAAAAGAVIGVNLAARRARVPPDLAEPWSMHPEYTASFRMRDSLTFAVVVWGTRGDVQPVLVLAQELQRRGHKVRLSVPPEHVELAAKFHLEDSTTPLVTGVAMEDATKVMGGGGGSPLDFFRTFFSKATDPMLQRWLELTDGADVVVGQLAPFTTATAMAAARKRGIPLVLTAHDPMVLPSPRCPVFGKRPGESSLLHMQIVNMMFGKFGRDAITAAYRDLELELPSWGTGAVPLPYLYSLPLLVTFPKTLYDVATTGAPAWWHQTGPWQAAARLTDEANVDEELATFVTQGDQPPVFIGFGSLAEVMVKGDKKAAFTEAMYAALLETGNTRVVLQGGSVDPTVQPPAGLSVLEQRYLPHGWLFSRCKAAFVHGGAGTTATAVAAGHPVVVVPATPLQAPWGGLIKDVGAGCSMDPKKLTDKGAWTAALQHIALPAVVESAERVGAEVSRERRGGVQRAVDALLEDLERLHLRNTRA